MTPSELNDAVRRLVDRLLNFDSDCDPHDILREAADALKEQAALIAGMENLIGCAKYHEHYWYDGGFRRAHGEPTVKPAACQCEWHKRIAALKESP